MTTITAVNIASQIVEDNYPDSVYGENENNWVSYRLEEAQGTGSFDGEHAQSMLEAAAQQGLDHMRAKILSTIQEWSARVDNIQQDDMPGFVSQYVPSLIGLIDKL
jgi:hypothetical protein